VNVTSIWVTYAKFHRNPSFCLSDFQFSQTAVTDPRFRHECTRLTESCQKKIEV